MKQLLLLFFITNLSFFSLYAQVPSNNLIQNATLVDESPFFERSIRIMDGMVNNGGQQGGCDLNGFKLVYYKFNATYNADITITLDDTRESIISAFAIIFTAPNLNVTDNADLTLASVCQYSTITNNQAIVNYTITAGTNYYILISRAEAGWSNITIDIPQDVDPTEKNVLLDLYNNTDDDGTGWTISENWNSNNPVSTWHGITVKNGHVSKINLRGNNLNGTIPNTLETLSFMEEVDFSSNRLNGELPDLGVLNNINKLWVNNNNFSFQDLETHYSSNNNITDFNYQIQNKRDTEDAFDGIIGNSYMLSMTDIAGTNVQYQWYKKRLNYFDNSDEPIATANNKDYTINVLTNSGMDIYICKATSSIITDLTIERNSIEITGEVSQLQKDALIAIYNSTNGDNWNNNTNWLSDEPLSTWHGVTIIGNKVTKLDFESNNLTGTLPSEIGDLANLEWLSFYAGNSINGDLPEEISNLTELRVLSFEYNNFTGDIPASYSNLTKLRGFWFNNNQLTGNVPEFLKTFNNLVFIDVSFNKFSGALPDLTNLQKLRYLSTSNNYFNANDFQSQFNDYLNLENSWSNNYYYSPQFTLDVAEEITMTSGSSITLTLADVPATPKSTNSKSILTANTYQWYKDSTPITGANSSSYTINNAQVSDSGVYYCTIINSDIPDLVIERQPITLNIGALSVEDAVINIIDIYPNPTRNLLNIKLNNIEIEQATLFDISGKQILDLELKSKITIADISNLKSGIYLLKIKTPKNTFVKRIIKE